MNRYYVEFKDSKQTNGTYYVYVRAYSVAQVRDIFDEYDIVAIDITD
jgi:hypothetical protein